ncbi:MAG TPA: pyrroloquinoline quinone biosynthesis peptide chaperone PqqD [Deinococcales bacterium]|nr:pyrroloquinoline quinone biosynthesis peptide chaperone PqqD [Deinococcales bacterium]
MDASPLPAKPELARRARMRFDATRDSHVLLLPERVVLLSESAAEILGLCDGERSLDDIVAELQSRYEEAPAADLRADVTDFLQEAKERKWLERET